jgi:Mg-chelatase subunit ChlD
MNGLMDLKMHNDKPAQKIPPPLTMPPLPPVSRATGFGDKSVDDDRTNLVWIGIGVSVLFILLMLFALIGIASRGQGQAQAQGKRDGQSEAGYVEVSLGEENTSAEQNLSSGAPGVADSSHHEDSSIPGEETSQKAEENSEGVGNTSDEFEGAGENDADDSARTIGLAEVPNRQVPAGGRTRPPISNGIEVDLSSSNGMNPFVGQGKRSDSTVFVIDVSGSMMSDNRLPRVIRSLTKAIEALEQKQMFAVILFDTDYLMPPHTSGLVPATRQNKDYILQWLSAPPGGGGTDPTEAMFVAIGLKPERIVLLTDGEFDPTAAVTITLRNQSNTKPSRIDCVGLDEQVLVLQEIAKRNQGIYYQAR